MNNLTTILCVGILSSCSVGFADTTMQGYPVLPPVEGEMCAVCGVEVGDDDIVLMVRGRRVPLKREMAVEFLENQDKYFSSMQPKSALFQEDMNATRGTSLGGVGQGWFLLGLYVLTALVFGGMSGYAAVSRGLKPIPNFFIGFFLNAFGYLYVLTRSSVAKPGEVPPGLSKVPLTSQPASCEFCGAMNHPSARKCTGCGKALTPTTDSEVNRV